MCCYWRTTNKIDRKENSPFQKPDCWESGRRRGRGNREDAEAEEAFLESRGSEDEAPSRMPVLNNWDGDRPAYWSPPACWRPRYLSYALI